MGKRFISEDALAAAVEAISTKADYANWKWSDVAKVAGAGLAAYVIGSTVNGHIKVDHKMMITLNYGSLLTTDLQKRRAYAKIEAHMAKVNQRKEELRRLLTDSKTGQLVTPERREILELDILELAERLQHGTLKPTGVLQAYQVNTEQRTPTTVFC